MKALIRFSFILGLVLSSKLGLAADTPEVCANMFSAIAQTEERKVDDLVSYLRSNGIDTSYGQQGLDLNRSGVVPSARTDNPIVGVSVSSNFANRPEHRANDNAWVFGKIAGQVLIGGKSVYASGHTFFLQTSLRQLASTWQEAPTSLVLFGPNCQLHLNTFMSEPSAMFSYLITASQLSNHPQAVRGFLKRFTSLGRN
ncbi:MAG: hypothetical protein HWE34_11995 [Methylocystaceae bacterium]|nr:hypothetical protein [Methylocystaceae bacterium]